MTLGASKAGSILTSATNPKTEAPVAVDRITPETVLKYQGMDVQARDLESLGVLQRLADGSYAEAGMG